MGSLTAFARVSVDAQLFEAGSIVDFRSAVNSAVITSCPCRRSFATANVTGWIHTFEMSGSPTDLPTPPYHFPQISSVHAAVRSRWNPHLVSCRRLPDIRDDLTDPIRGRGLLNLAARGMAVRIFREAAGRRFSSVLRSRQIGFGRRFSGIDSSSGLLAIKCGAALEPMRSVMSAIIRTRLLLALLPLAFALVDGSEAWPQPLLPGINAPSLPAPPPQQIQLPAIPQFGVALPPNGAPPLPQDSFGDRAFQCLQIGSAAGLTGGSLSAYSGECADQ
jgi:hypothetical protein